MAAPKLCTECGEDEKKPGHPLFCFECWLSRQPVEAKVAWSAVRRDRIPEGMRIARVPKSEWPPGRRWCAGCQSFPRLRDCRGSRCVGCVSGAAHARHIERTYGITDVEYAELLEAQGGRCYICTKKPKTLRLAVDHDHKTGEVRGLLCSGERSCNHDVLGNLEGTGDALAAAHRIVAYLVQSPARRLWGEDVPRQPLDS